MTPSFIVRAGALHLADLVRPDGRFVYAYRLGGQASPDYNLLRHCGTIWSMAESAESLPGLPGVADAAQRALAWLLAGKTVAVGRGRCVTAGNDIAKLGGAALAILAILACLELSPPAGRDALIRQARQFGRFILMLRRTDGDFLHKVNLKTREALPFRSDFYTGQALFALCRLSRATGEPHWHDAAIDAIATLGAADYGVAQQSHWMLYALEAAGRAESGPACLDHAMRIVAAILDNPAYRDRGLSTPIACRSEGLLAFLRLSAGATAPAVTAMRRHALTAIAENLAIQARSFRPSGAFTAGEDQDEVRIDYIQHNISSFLHYHVLTRGSGPMTESEPEPGRS